MSLIMVVRGGAESRISLPRRMEGLFRSLASSSKEQTDA
jgi:hypothetical protein